MESCCDNKHNQADLYTENSSSILHQQHRHCMNPQRQTIVISQNQSKKSKQKSYNDCDLCVFCCWLNDDDFDLWLILRHDRWWCHRKVLEKRCLFFAYVFEICFALKILRHIVETLRFVLTSTKRRIPWQTDRVHIHQQVHNLFCFVCCCVTFFISSLL